MASNQEISSSFSAPYPSSSGLKQRCTSLATPTSKHCIPVLWQHWPALPVWWTPQHGPLSDKPCAPAKNTYKKRTMEEMCVSICPSSCGASCAHFALFTVWCLLDAGCAILLRRSSALLHDKTSMHCVRLALHCPFFHPPKLCLLYCSLNCAEELITREPWFILTSHSTTIWCWQRTTCLGALLLIKQW